MVSDQGSADFSGLGKIEFTGPTALHEFSEQGRIVAANAHQILQLAGFDLFGALNTISPADMAEAMRRMSRNSPSAKARRVVRHVFAACDALLSAQVSFAKLPVVYRKVYEAEISGGGRRTRPTFNVHE